MNKPQKGCDLTKCFLCRNTLPEWHEAINLHKQNLKFKKGEVIFSEGQPVTGIYFVYSGTAKVHKKWGEDKELIIRFASDGAIFGHRGLGSKLIYAVSATAIEPVVVCFVDIKFFEASLKINNNLSYELMMLFAEELDLSEGKMRDLAHMSAKGRVAQALLSLEEQFGKDAEGNINLELSRHDLAAFAASTYETLFRVIADLTRDNIVMVTGKRLRINNRQQMAALTTDS